MTTHFVVQGHIFVSLLNVPETRKCISGMDLLRQLHCCHTQIEEADQNFYPTQSWSCINRVATGVAIFKSLVWLDLETDPLQIEGSRPEWYISSIKYKQIHYKSRVPDQNGISQA